MDKSTGSQPSTQSYWGWKGRPFPPQAERIILPGGRPLEDAVIWPNFCQEVLELDPHQIWKALAKFPTWPHNEKLLFRPKGDKPHWISGEQPALKYRGNVLRRSKMWCQSDYKAGLARYGYTGWQHAISYATHDVEYVLPVKQLAEKLNEGLAEPGRAEPHNHWIVTRYEDQEDNIGFHSDKNKDFAENSFFVVIKFGEPRPFAFRLPPKNENDEPNDQRPFFSRALSPGTAIFVRCKAPTGELAAANELVQHGVPAHDAVVGESGSIVSRCIITRTPWDKVRSMIDKRPETDTKKKRKEKEEKKRLEAEHERLSKPTPAKTDTIAIHKIDPGWELALRVIDKEHVNKLKASINDQGLLEPLVVDRNGVLLAGHHRFEALKQLQNGDSDRFNGWFPRSHVPVLRLNIDAEKDTQIAAAAAISENRKRKELSREVIKKFCDTMAKKHNIHMRSGRPPKGKVSMSKLLSDALQVSPRHVRRMKNDKGPNKPGRGVRVSPAAAAAEHILKATLAGGNISEDDWSHMPVLKKAAALLSALDLHEEDMAILGQWCARPAKERVRQVESEQLWGG